MANQTELIRVLRSIPPKWALGIVGLLIGYWLVQPVANRSFGWSLPTLVQIVNNDYAKPDTKPDTKSETKPGKNNENKTAENDKIAKKGESASTEKLTEKPKAPSTTAPKVAVPKVAVPKADVAKSSVSKSSVSKEGPTFGYLKSMGRDRYESPEGLVYAPGSEEGHRIKHVERHIKDIPSRPGSHGVFEGNMAQFLETIDRGYRMALSKAKGTKIRDEDGMTIMEITFDKKIGFVGGSDGRRKGTPSTNRLRIVLSGDRVITAFPY